MPEPILDDDLLDRLQRSAFGYFLEATNPANGLVADTSREGSPASIAVVGFALSAYPVAVERSWLTRDDAARRTLVTLRFFEASTQGLSPNATGYQGFYYHFLDLESGRRVWRCELSPIDTALFIAGVLTAAAYFTHATFVEGELRRLARELFDRIDWNWARNGKATVAQGFKPECGFLHYDWQGYNEAALLYVLGLASDTFPLPSSSYAAWTATYQWERIYGCDLLYAGPLFIHQFSHAWIDFRKIQDPFMREKGSDYFENSRRAIDVQREYARQNPNGYGTYGADCWGLSAGDGPGSRTARIHGRQQRFSEYTARGVPYGPDDGTIAPGAALASLPFAPSLALSATRHFLELYPEWTSTWRLPSGFNRDAPSSDPERGWISEGFYGLDQGIVVLMIENHRTGLIWKLMRSSQIIRAGLKRAGFEGGWL
ncbi:MAG TPA: glucoamylase family protein [Polyangiaceae bacterium]